MSGEHELPTASVVRSSQATPPAAVDNSAPMSHPQGSTYRSQFGVQTTGATSAAALKLLARCQFELASRSVDVMLMLCCVSSGTINLPPIGTSGARLWRTCMRASATMSAMLAGDAATPWVVPGVDSRAQERTHLRRYHRARRRAGRTSL